jgi:hypothetical protein
MLTFLIVALSTVQTSRPLDISFLCSTLKKETSSVPAFHHSKLLNCSRQIEHAWHPHIPTFHGFLLSAPVLLFGLVTRATTGTRRRHTTWAVIKKRPKSVTNHKPASQANLEAFL